jgi:hypothetical protein
VRFGDLPCRVLAWAGLRWCGGWRRPNLEDPHDQAQTQAERRAPLNHPKGSQAGAPQAIGARIVQITRTIRYQARPYYCDVANIGWRDDCVSRHRN